MGRVADCHGGDGAHADGMRFVLFVLALFSAPWTPAVVAAAAELRVMTFNVRNSRSADGEDAWPKRKEFLLATVREFRGDLIGFQEVLADQYDELVARLPGYGWSGVARDDGVRKGEWSCVAYRQERFAEVTKGDFWLSETPTVVGSKSWDAALTRICSWVRLRDKATGREVVFANTHFDHRGVVARREAARVLSEQLSRIAPGVPAILVGDFNITEDTPAYTALIRPEAPDAIRWIDAYRAVHPVRQPEEASFHGFKGTVAGSRIDFIFHTAHFRATEATIVRVAKDGRYPSDHYPVTAVLAPRG